jgi:hypothetical protein
MSDEFDCPGCSAHLTARQLRMTSVVTETCPRCGTIIRQGDAFRYENTEAIIAEDVDAIDTWLTAERQGMHFEYQQLRDREAQGEYLWRAIGAPLAGCPDNWAIEVFYTTKSPGIVAVRITATEEEYLDDDITAPLLGVFRGHGLQPHGSRGAKQVRKSYLTAEDAEPGKQGSFVTPNAGALPRLLPREDQKQPKNPGGNRHSSRLIGS